MIEPSVMFTNEAGESCSECGHEIPKSDAVVIWRDLVFDTLACYQEAYTRWETQEGLDHIASRDQAVAAVLESLKGEPRQFIFVFEEEENSITTTVFSHPEFVMQAVAALMESVTLHEPTVAPPPDREGSDE